MEACWGEKEKASFSGLRLPLYIIPLVNHILRNFLFHPKIYQDYLFDNINGKNLNYIMYLQIVLNYYYYYELFKFKSY